tara:strand:- start:434 stop:646 length:213 start_codon:yes stop_codon:yes gene_type:complete
MPDPTYLAISLIFSSIGLGYFIYGRKQKYKIPFYTGIALMIYPYFVTSALGMITIGVVLMLTPKLIKHFL